MTNTPRAAKANPAAKASARAKAKVKPSKAKEAKPQTDWEAIEREYRAGQFSVREVASRNGVTHKAITYRAGRNGWERALAHKIPGAVRERLAKEDALTQAVTQSARAGKDREILDSATTVGAEIVKLHRKDISQLQEIKAILSRRLVAYMNGEELDGPLLGERESPSDILEKLGRTTARLIPLERQAYSIDDAPVREDPLDAIMGMIDGNRWTATAA